MTDIQYFVFFIFTNKDSFSTQEGMKKLYNWGHLWGKNPRLPLRTGDECVVYAEESDLQPLSPSLQKCQQRGCWHLGHGIGRQPRSLSAWEAMPNCETCHLAGFLSMRRVISVPGAPSQLLLCAHRRYISAKPPQGQPESKVGNQGAGGSGDMIGTSRILHQESFWVNILGNIRRHCNHTSTVECCVLWNEELQNKRKPLKRQHCQVTEYHLITSLIISTCKNWRIKSNWLRMTTYCIFMQLFSSKKTTCSRCDPKPFCEVMVRRIVIFYLVK